MYLVTESVTVMVDTINMRRRGGVSKTERKRLEGRLRNRSSHYFEKSGQGVVKGFLPNLNGLPDTDLKVTISENSVKIGETSLCKWFLGNNLYTMTARDLKHAIEAIGDLLHLPMDGFEVARLDVGHNLIMEYSVAGYLNQLGALARHDRQRMSATGLYYKTALRTVVLYDKIEECRKNRGVIPTEYAGHDVLRLEVRFLNRVAAQLGYRSITAEMLKCTELYRKLLDKWAEYYWTVDKINDVMIDFRGIKTKRELYQTGVAKLVEEAGGELGFLDQISEAQTLGDLTKKQAHDLRGAVKFSCRGSLTTRPNNLITELEDKVRDAVKLLGE
ncbi:MAG: hypothetical protein KF870_13235 [Leadbetterella sp.]|nr:hypothetical protein [Leadbetterella sp.]